MRFSLDVGRFAFRRLLKLFDNHVIPCQQLFYDLAVTYHVANDAQSNRSGDEGESSVLINILQ